MTTWSGRVVIRAAIVNHRTNEADSEYAIRAVERLRTRYLARG
jgi:hypothetical protein